MLVLFKFRQSSRRPNIVPSGRKQTFFSPSTTKSFLRPGCRLSTRETTAHDPTRFWWEKGGDLSCTCGVWLQHNPIETRGRQRARLVETYAQDLPKNKISRLHTRLSSGSARAAVETVHGVPCSPLWPPASSSSQRYPLVSEMEVC